MNLGKTILALRKSKNVTQEDLAAELGVTAAAVSKWENDSAVPDLDKLIKMSTVFGVSLDTLVFGDPTAPVAHPVAEPSQTPQPPATTVILPSVRSIVGCIMLVFGMTFFLLSIFWGNHLALGEAFGEFASIVVVLLSIAILGFDRFSVLSICAVIYFIYCVIAYGILHVTSIWNYLFVFFTGAVILVWFIMLGLRKTVGITFHPKTLDNPEEPTDKESNPPEKESE